MKKGIVSFLLWGLSLFVPCLAQSVDLTVLPKTERNAMLVKIVQDFPEFLLAKCTDWQNSGYIYQYLWMQFKHKEYKNGLLIRSITTDSDGTEVSMDEFIYDSHDNVFCISNQSGITIQKISYGE